MAAVVMGDVLSYGTRWGGVGEKGRGTETISVYQELQVTVSCVPLQIATNLVRFGAST
jgi:hypothetical protein